MTFLFVLILFQDNTLQKNFTLLMNQELRASLSRNVPSIRLKTQPPPPTPTLSHPW